MMRGRARRIGWGTTALLILFPIAVAALSISLDRFDAFTVPPLAWLGLILAAVLYGAAHLLRAIRLAILSAPALNMQLRTVIYLHFHTAPVSFIVPFKLGEFYRWQQLAWVSGSPVGSLLILLLDRTLDAIILLSVLAMVLGSGRRLPPGMAWVLGLLTLATVLGLIAIFVVPNCLRAMQAYILRQHSALRARRALRVVDTTRLMFGCARERLQGNVILLLLISAIIWLLEGAVLTVLTRLLDPNAWISLTSWMTVTLFPQAATVGATALTTLYAFTCLVTLFLIWPVATGLYIARLRLRSPVTAEQRPLSARKPRRIHLYSADKML